LRGVRRLKLANGLRVCLRHVPAWPVVSVHGWVGVGSIDEEASESGLSHILEHMVFKGTRRRRAAEISRWVEAQGGALNAETSREYTHFYVDVPSEGTQAAVELLGGLLCGATLEPGEWARECPVILEEIKRRHDDPDSLLWDLLNESLYADPRWRRPVIGSPETVRAVTADQVRRFYRRHYTVDRCVVTVVGDFDEKDVRRWLERAFSSMPAVGAPRTPRDTDAASPRPVPVRMQKPVRQSYAAYGFCTPPASSDDHDALDLLATILGDGRNARLVERLREDQRLVWSIGVSNLTHEGPGLFGVFAECDVDKERLLSGALDREWQRLRHSPPSAVEIARAKNLMQAAWWQSFETVHSQAATLGLYALEDQLDRLSSYWNRIRRLDQADLVSIIDRYGDAPMGSAVITS